MPRSTNSNDEVPPGLAALQESIQELNLPTPRLAHQTPVRKRKISMSDRKKLKRKRQTESISPCQTPDTFDEHMSDTGRLSALSLPGRRPVPSSDSKISTRRPRLKRPRKLPQQDPVLPDSEIDRILEETALKNNLSAVNVKSILKNVLSNSSVKRMLNRRLREAGQEVGEDTDDTDVEYEPKLTRARKKAILGSSTSTPVCPSGSPSESRALMDQEFPDDSSDEEYKPENAVNESEDESYISSQASDIGSPVAVHHALSEGSTEQLADHDGFKIPRVPDPRTLSFSSKEQDIIGLRTRSKHQIDTPIEHLEATFVPPDITADMYDSDVDDVFKQFLVEFQFPRVQRTPAQEEDEEHDPEYNVLEDKEDVDREELRYDRSVRISKQEVKELIEELIDTFDLEEEVHPVEVSHPAKVSGVPIERSLIEDIESCPTTPLIEGKVLSPQAVASEEGTVKQTPNIIVTICLPPTASESSATPAATTDSEATAALFSAQTRLRLEDQLRKHVQLLTQNHLVTSQQPKLFELRDKCQTMLNDLDFRRVISLPFSPWNVYNLPEAMKLTSEWRAYCDKHSEISSDARTAYTFVEKDGKMLASKPMLPKPHPELLKRIFSSRVFLCPKLLPQHTFFKEEPEKDNAWMPSEVMLLAHGMEMFTDWVKENSFFNDSRQIRRSVCSMVAHYVTPAHSKDDVYNKVKRSFLDKASPNPVKFYRLFGTAPPIADEAEPFFPSETKTLLGISIEDLPKKWQRYRMDIEGCGVVNGKERRNYKRAPVFRPINLSQKVEVKCACSPHQPKHPDWILQPHRREISTNTDGFEYSSDETEESVESSFSKKYQNWLKTQPESGRANFKNVQDWLARTETESSVSRADSDTMNLLIASPTRDDTVISVGGPSKWKETDARESLNPKHSVASQKQGRKGTVVASSGTTQFKRSKCMVEEGSTRTSSSWATTSSHFSLFQETELVPTSVTLHGAGESDLRGSITLYKSDDSMIERVNLQSPNQSSLINAEEKSGDDQVSSCLRISQTTTRNSSTCFEDPNLRPSMSEHQDLVVTQNQADRLTSVMNDGSCAGYTSPSELANLNCGKSEKKLSEPGIPSTLVHNKVPQQDEPSTLEKSAAAGALKSKNTEPVNQMGEHTESISGPNLGRNYPPPSPCIPSTNRIRIVEVLTESPLRVDSVVKEEADSTTQENFERSDLAQRYVMSPVPVSRPPLAPSLDLDFSEPRNREEKNSANQGRNERESRNIDKTLMSNSVAVGLVEEVGCQDSEITFNHDRVRSCDQDRCLDSKESAENRLVNVGSEGANWDCEGSLNCDSLESSKRDMSYREDSCESTQRVERMEESVTRVNRAPSSTANIGDTAASQAECSSSKRKRPKPKHRLLCESGPSGPSENFLISDGRSSCDISFPTLELENDGLTAADHTAANCKDPAAAVITSASCSIVTRAHEAQTEPLAVLHTRTGAATEPISFAGAHTAVSQKGGQTPNCSDVDAVPISYTGGNTANGQKEGQNVQVTAGQISGNVVGGAALLTFSGAFSSEGGAGGDGGEERWQPKKLPDDGEPELKEQELKKSKKKRQQKPADPEHVLASLNARPDALTFAHAYIERVQSTTSEETYNQFLALLHSFEESQGALELYKMVLEVLKGHDELCNEFIAFLTPEEAQRCGRLFKKSLVDRMREFFAVLMTYFKGQPGHVKRIIVALTSLQAQGATMEAVKGEVIPLLRGHIYLNNLFLSLLPSEEPHFPEDHRAEEVAMNSSDSSNDFEVVKDPSFEEEPPENPSANQQCSCVCHQGASANPEAHCYDCGLKFADGKVYIKTESGLKLATVIKEPVEPEHSAEVSPSSGTSRRRSSPRSKENSRRRKPFRRIAPTYVGPRGATPTDSN